MATLSATAGNAKVSARIDPPSTIFGRRYLAREIGEGPSTIVELGRRGATGSALDL